MGCGSSQVGDPQFTKDREVRPIIKGFNNKLQQYIKGIVKEQFVPTDDLKTYFSFFLNNETYFSIISQDQSLCSQYHGLIKEGIQKLLQCIQFYIESHLIYAYSISKILSMFSLVLFAFYSDQGKARYLKQKEQQELIEQIEHVEELFKIERKNNTLSNNIQFYLFFIKSAIASIPTDQNEGKQILQLFGKGVLEAAFTFSISEELLESLGKGVVYIFQEYKLYKLRRNFKVMYSINKVKISVLYQLENSKNEKTLQQLMEPLQKLYQQVIKKSQDWEIWCFWIYTISEIIQYKPKHKKSELKLDNLSESYNKLSESEKKSIVHEINDEEFVFEINWKKAHDNENIKKISIQNPLYQFQSQLLIGDQYLEGFEQLFLSKISQDKSTSDLIDDSLILKNINFLTHIRELSLEFLELNEKQQFDLGTVQKQIQLISEVITNLSQLELQLQEFSIWEKQFSDQEFQEEIIDLQISELVNSFIVNYEQFQNQKFQNLVDELFKKEIKNLWSIIQRDQQYENQEDPIESLKTICDKIKKQDYFIQLTETQLKTKIINVIRIIFCTFSFLRMNISILLNIQVELKTFQIQQNDQQYKTHLLVQKPNQLVTLFNYQLTNDSLQILYQLVQQINQSENKKIQQNRIQSKLKIVIEGRLSMFRFQYSQLREIAQSNQNKNDKVLQKVVCESLIAACEKIEKYLKQLTGGLKLISDLIAFQSKTLGQEVLVDNQELKNLEEFLINLQTTQNVNEAIQGMDNAFKNFIKYVERYDQELNQYLNKKTNIESLQKKSEQLKNIQECIQVIQGIEITKERNKSIIQAINQYIKHVYSMELNLADNIGQIKFEDEIEYFKLLIQETEKLQSHMQQTIKKLNQNLIDLKCQLNEENEVTKIKTLQKIIPEIQYQNSVENQSKQNQIPQVRINQDHINDHQFPDYPIAVEKDIYFLLDQIGSQEECHQQKNIYNIFKQTMSDIINEHQWRIRQTIVYSLIQIKDRCLQEKSYKIVSGLIVKLSILETDNRIKQLFNDQMNVQEMNKLTLQYWPTQEESIQRIIKEKLKYLDALSCQISSERQPEKKKALIKKFNNDQEEINNQIRNIESLSSSLGITVLFLQDLKNNLLRIENQLKVLQDSINEIGQNIKYLIGKPFIELLELRMERVLEQAQIINAEKVYVPIKTREKNFSKEIEDEETTLFTDSIVGEGEINEFLWQQKKHSLLIHGVAGSGKSTAARKIEEFLWGLYNKAKTNTELIPNIPIFISLPQLKDPLYNAVEETLKSDNYRFNHRHLEEFKEAIESGKYRIIFILDSYDELNQQYIQSNLNVSNKLSKWKSKKDSQTDPKIITTCRTELFTVNKYHTWFLSESNDINCFKEVRLITFNEQQTKEYFEQYHQLTQKKIIREHTFIEDEVEFEKIWKQDIWKLQIEKIVKKDQVYLVQQLLNEIWDPSKYIENISTMNIWSLLETPFMLEIVVVVLPEIVSSKRNKDFIKQQFIQKFSEYSKDSETTLKEWNNLIDQKYEKFWTQYLDAFTDEQIKHTIDRYFKENEQISAALRIQPLTSYDFYLQFFRHYFDRETQKLSLNGEHVNLKDLWQFTQSLAVEMTFKNVSSVKYEQKGQLFEREIDWKDKYFDDSGEVGQIRRKIIRCIPLNQKNNIYSFNHKSLQEFLVAKWFIEIVKSTKNGEKDIKSKRIEDEKFFNELNWQHEFLQGVVRVVSEKLKNDKNAEDYLYKIITDSKSGNPQAVRAASNSFHILNKMNYSFREKDLNNIVLEDVDLSGINFYKTDLSYSKFTNVNISYCNFSEVNLTAVKWEKTKLNDTFSEEILEVKFMKLFDECCLLVQKSGLEIICYNPSNFAEIQDYHFSCLSEYVLIDITKLIKKENDGLALACNKSSIQIVDFKQDQIIWEISCSVFDQLPISDDEKFLYYYSYGNIIQFDISQLKKKITNKTQQSLQTKKIYWLSQGGIQNLKYSGNYFFSKYYCIDIKAGNQIWFNQPNGYKYDQMDAKNSIVVFANQNKPYQICVYHESNLEDYKQLVGHQEEIQKLTIIKNGKRLLSYDRNGTLIYWDLQEYKKVYEMYLSGIEIFATHNNLQQLCIYRNHKFEMWDIVQSSMKQNLQQSHQIYCCALSYDDHYAITGSKLQSSIIIWDLQNGKQLGQTIPIDDIICLEFSTDSLSFYSSTMDGYIYQWELATQKQLIKINNLFDSIEQIYPIDLNHILTIQSDKLVKLWNIREKTFQLIYNHDDDEELEQFKTININEYYERSMKHPFLADVQSKKCLVSIQRSKLEVQLFTKRIMFDDQLDLQELHEMDYGENSNCIIQNYTAFVLQKGENIQIYQPRNLLWNKQYDRTYPQEIYCDHVQNMIYYQEYLICLTQRSSYFVDEIEELEIMRDMPKFNMASQNLHIEQQFQKQDDKIVQLDRQKLSEYLVNRQRKRQVAPLQKLRDKVKQLAKVEQLVKDGQLKKFDIKSSIEYRKLTDLETIHLQIDILEKIKEGIHCFDANEDILYFGGIQGTLFAFDINEREIIYQFKPHSSKITQIKYLTEYKSVLTVSEDSKIILSKLTNIIDEQKEENGKPILFLSVSQDQNQIMIGTQRCLTLYFLKNQKLMQQEIFNQFENIKSLFVDFENLDVLIVDGDERKKGHLSLKRVIQPLQKKFKYKPSKICYDNESRSIYIANDCGGINCWNVNGKKIKTIIENTQDTKIIRHIKSYKNFILISKINGDNNCVNNLYDLKQGGKLVEPINRAFEEVYQPSTEFQQIHLLNDGKSSISVMNNSFTSENESIQLERESVNKIKGSDIKKTFLAIFGDNYFGIYNSENLSLIYNFSLQTEMSCDYVIIEEESIIENQDGMDIRFIFKEKKQIQSKLNVKNQNKLNVKNQMEEIQHNK